MPSRLRRRTAALIAPLVWAGWLTLMSRGDHWALFNDNAFMTITMVFGSFIAGATSEGGGAVAFPVMTLLFGIEPVVARDFALMIQAVGMTAAAATIALLRIRVEWRAVLWGTLGGAAGIVAGIEWVAPRVAPAYVKMFFTSLWLAFGASLFWLNRNRERRVFRRVPEFRPSHGVLLLAVGLLGGVVSGLTGSGLDILTFTLLSLFFRIDEKVATPTSVVLMGVNSVLGFAWLGAIRQTVQPEAWSYWWVCVPVVVVGAPLGARFMNERTRHIVAAFLLLSIGIQFVGSLWIVPQTPRLLGFSAATFAIGLLLFGGMSRLGAMRARRGSSDTKMCASVAASAQRVRRGVPP